MAKLTKEEIQALLKVSDYHWYHQEKKVTQTGSRSYNDIVEDNEVTQYQYVYTKETVTHLVELWSNRPNVYTGKAWSRDENTAWRNAYKKLMNGIANG